MASLTFSISETGFLEYHMYHNSKAKTAVSTRFWIRTSLSLLSVGAGLYACFTENLYFGSFFIVFGIVTYLLYPWRSRKTHERFFTKYIRENYGQRIKNTQQLTVDGSLFSVKDTASETRFEAAEIEKVLELNTLFTVKLKNGASLLFSKKDPANTQSLREIFDLLGIGVQNEMAWKWK